MISAGTYWTDGPTKYIIYIPAHAFCSLTAIVMCVSQEFTVANIADKVWAIPTVKRHLEGLPDDLLNATRTPFVQTTTCLNGRSKEKKNSVDYVRNSDHREDENSQNCLLRISILRDSHSFECIFTCYYVKRYAKITFYTHRFLPGYDGISNDNKLVLTDNSVLGRTFGRINSSPPAVLEGTNTQCHYN